MEFLRDLLVVLHIVGIAALLGGFLPQISSSPRRVVPAMRDGAWTMLVTGVALVGLHSAGKDELGAIDNTKITIKLLVLLAILGLVLWGRRKEFVPTWVWAGIGGLTLVNIVIAVFWH
jgi:hypothetical protein